MSKNKYLLIGGSVTIVLLLVIIGGIIYNRQIKGQNLQSRSDGLEVATASGESPTSTSSGTLGVSSGGSGATNLGQIAPNGQGQSGAGSSGGGDSVSEMLNPANFKQYDKYKNEQNGLFAELQKGNGAELTPGKKAAVYYRGWLTNGTMFDQSRADAPGNLQPFVFTLGAGQVIRGWEQALSGMKVGAVRLVIVPPAAGYGSQAQSGIPANSVLVFQVQLADVE